MGILSETSGCTALGARTKKGSHPKFGDVVIRELNGVSLDEARLRLIELCALESTSFAVPYDVFSEKGKVYAVRPWIKGQPLKGPVGVDEAEKAVSLLADLPEDFLIYDLRPEHLIRAEDGKIMLCDAGFNKRGTLPYASPEQINRSEINKASNSYQLGACLYHLLEGRVPPDARTLLIPDVELAELKKVPDIIAESLRRCFEASGADRPSASELLKAFRELKEQKIKDADEKNNVSLKKAEAEKAAAEKAEAEASVSEIADKFSGFFNSKIKKIDFTAACLVIVPLAAGCLFGAAALSGGWFNYLDRAPEVSVKESKAPPSKDNLPNSWVCSKDGSRMILIPAGPFYKGPVPEAGKSVKPKVTNLNAFYIDRYEVTNRQFMKFVKETGYKAQGSWQKAASEDRLDHPVIMVSYYDCEAYAKWAGKRLPTAAEWEKAARGGDLRLYPWGGSKADASKFNCSESGIGNTCRVGSYPQGASPYGVEDMAGNVWEWVDSWYIPYGAGTEYTSLTKTIKGGSKSDKGSDCIIVMEKGVMPEQGRLVNSGFRCVFDPIGLEKNSEPSDSGRKLRSLESLMPKESKKKEPVKKASASEALPPDYSAPEGDYDYHFDEDYSSEYQDSVYESEEASENAEYIESEEIQESSEGAAEPEEIEKESPKKKYKFDNGDIPDAPDPDKPREVVVPDFDSGASSGYIEEEQVNYH